MSCRRALARTLLLLLGALLLALPPARAQETASVAGVAVGGSLPSPVAPGGTPEPVPVSPEYRVGPGDTLQVLVYGEAGLSGPFPVSDGGNLDFPLLGSLSVAGRTAAEVTELLRSKLTPGYLLNPNVNVWVASYRSQPVQVLGDVAKPGVYYLRGPTTVLQMLSEAGGVSRAGVNEVRVTHGGEGGTLTVLAYDQLLTQRIGDVPLSAGDIVFVPQSLITVMGQVAKPGEIAFRDGLTVAQCIAAAGGSLPVADLGHVYILRGDARIRVNVRKVLKGKASDVPVQPGDRVFVRESAV